MNGTGADERPGYRRCILVVPEPGCVTALVEDDIHSMAVRLRHDGATVLAVEPVIDRMPWSTCPGSAAVLVETFAGVALAEVTLRKERKSNCTHLHDMAVLAAAHAGDRAPIRFDIAASDPVAGRRELSLSRNGEPLLLWIEQDGVLVAPEDLVGRTLMTLRDWIATLPDAQAEAARLLQWGSLVAHGRTKPMAAQSDASQMPANCYTFQPERTSTARRVGQVIDFSAVPTPPGQVLTRMLGIADKQLT
ncbi:MAG: DUF2889 domain-containing protein [Hyphomicrobiaceae bacterium]